MRIISNAHRSRRVAASRLFFRTRRRAAAGWHRRSALVAMVLPVLLCGACSGDSPVAVRDDLASVFWALTADANAVTIALNDTQQLTATPRNYRGDALTVDVPVTYRSADGSKVAVTPDGLVTGVAMTPGVAVIATATVDGVTNVDTTVVAVTATRAVLKTFTVQPLIPPYENPTVAMNSYSPLQVIAKDSAGNTVSGLAVRYTISDPMRGWIMGTLFSGKSPGPVDVIARTMSYGVMYVDTLHYTVTHIKQIMTQISSSVKTYMVVIGTDGSVTWQNGLTVPVSIEFSNDAAGIVGGHIPSLAPGMVAVRTFPTAGTYTWRNTEGSERGTVVVLQD